MTPRIDDQRSLGDDGQPLPETSAPYAAKVLVERLVEYGPDELAPYHRNPRRGDLDVITRSLQANGQYRPIVVNLGTKTGRPLEVLAGNHTLAAARALGWPTIAATTVDVDDQAAARIVVVDNRASDLASNDNDELIALLQTLPDLDGTGYTDADITDLLGAPDAPGETDPDDEPEPPTTPISQLGDVWRLGPHRLVCGDATDPEVIAAALDGNQAALVLTDPPYNVDYTGGTKQALKIVNDAMSPAAFKQLLNGFFRAALKHTIPGGPIYVFYATAEEIAFRQAMLDTGWLYKQNLVWIKDRFVLSRQDYHWQHEPILYGWKPGAAHRWYGGYTPTTLIDDQIDPARLKKSELIDIVTRLFDTTTAIRSSRPHANIDHPTSKPVALLVRLLENSSQHGDLVLDPFGGSGSTLIACHRKHRVAATVELDPRYADVICRRYQEHTGILPILDATGERYDFTDAAAHEADDDADDDAGIAV